MGKVHDVEVDIALHAGYHGPCLTEVALGVARWMMQGNEHLTGCSTAISYVVLDYGVPSVEPVLVPQPLVDPHGSVALLLRNVQVVLEYLVYDSGVRTYLGSSGRLASLVAGRSGVLEHLADGVSVQAEHPGGPADAHAVCYAGSSDTHTQFHAVHPSHLPSGRVQPYGRR